MENIPKIRLTRFAVAMLAGIVFLALAPLLFFGFAVVVFELGAMVYLTSHMVVTRDRDGNTRKRPDWRLCVLMIPAGFSIGTGLATIAPLLGGRIEGVLRMLGVSVVSGLVFYALTRYYRAVFRLPEPWVKYLTGTENQEKA